jgi:hypothetical protein
MPGRTEEIHKNVRTAVLHPRQEPGSSRTESSSVIYLPTTLNWMSFAAYE